MTERTQPRFGETEADDFFRADAEAKGYLAKGGAGLRAYYRDHGMVQPEVLRKDIPAHELTNFPSLMEPGSNDLFATDIEGEAVYRTDITGRHTGPEDVE